MVTSCGFSPDGKLLATGADDKKIFIWDSATGQLKHTLDGYTENILKVKFLNNDQLMSMGYDAVCVFSLSSENPCIAQFQHPYQHEFYSADMYGKQIIAFDMKGGIYNLQVDNI